MNLADILIPNRTPTGAERADWAENQQPCGLWSPPRGAEKGGLQAEPGQIRPNPAAEADAENRASSSFPPNPPNPPHPRAVIEKPLPVTTDYFRSQGVYLLPEDLAFLRWHLPKGTARRNAYVGRYLDAWHSAMGQEVVPHRKQNTGRGAANTWLRETYLA